MALVSAVSLLRMLHLWVPSWVSPAPYRARRHVLSLPWDAEEECFQCPCHASSFDIAGDVLAPPAPRPLDLYAVRIENGIVKVDTSRRIRRSAFLPSQEAHA